MAFLPLAAKVLMAVPDMTLFFECAGGHMVLAALQQAATAEPDHPHEAVPYADVGDRFGVSRTHVRQSPIVAQEAGLVRLTARGGRRVEILSGFGRVMIVACGRHVYPRYGLCGGHWTAGRCGSLGR